MSEEKKGFEPLSKEVLKDVTGGVPSPYEKPIIIEFTLEGTISCGTGTYCKTGADNSCKKGSLCANGTYEI